MFAAGAGAVAQIISELTGARVGSLADKIREECRARGMSTEREILRRVANEMRAKDAGYWAKKVIEDAEKAEKEGARLFVAEPIRSLGDLHAFEEKYGENAILVAVDAPLELRYQRALQRKREGEEKLSLEQFKEREAREARARAKPFEQNIPLIMSKARYKIVNDGSLEQLRMKTCALLKTIGIAPRRKLLE